MADTKRWYITVYPFKWGRGHSPEESKKVARKVGGRGTEWYTVRLPEHVQQPTFDGFGFNWTWPEDWTEAQRDAAQAASKIEDVAASRQTTKRRKELRARQAS